MPEIVKMAIGILSKEIRSKLITCLRNSFTCRKDKIAGCDANSFEKIFYANEWIYVNDYFYTYYCNF